MYHYYAFGLEISSEIELPGMSKGSGKSDIDISDTQNIIYNDADIDDENSMCVT